MEFSDAKALITVDGARRKGKTAPIKPAVDELLGDVAVDRDDRRRPEHRRRRARWSDGRDVWFHEAIEAADAECPAEPLDAEHPLFILYTSRLDRQAEGHPAHHRRLPDRRRRGPTSTSSTSSPTRTCTGARPTSAGSPATPTSSTGRCSTARRASCTRARPDYPHKGIWWELCERYGVTIFYTAPTAIRACMKWGAEHAEKHDLSKLRLLGTVGEPINPKAWLWYREVVGGGRCPIVDTWWQTETGADHDHDAARAPSRRKPGSAGDAAAGRSTPTVRRRGGQRGRSDGEQGLLALTRPWPGMLRTLFRDDERFVETYLVEVRPGDLPRRRRRAPGRGRLLLGHRAHRRRHQRLRPPPVDRRGRVGDRLAPEGRRGGGDRPGRRGHRPVDRRVRDARGRPRRATTS